MGLPLTIKETQEGLFKRRFSAVKLVDEYLKKIEENRDLNAFITISDELAYEQARRIDKILSENDEKILSDFPLLGVTVAHKDLYSTKGVRTTAGSKVLKSYIPSYSATVVDRLEKAGSIMLGKTNCDAWGHGASGENSDFGPTKNPWDKNRVAGGSSSGSGAAVAANMTLVATSTDTGGSTRAPANFCGVVGLKPTHGAVSRYGVIAMASSLDTQGVMARTVEDVEKLFTVIKGEDGKDGTMPNTKYEIRNRKLKVGIPKEYFIGGLDKEVEKSVLQSIKVFENQGVELVDISLPHTKYAVSVYYIVQPAEVSSNLGRYDEIRYGNNRNSFGAEAKRRIMLGTYVLSAGYYDAYYLKAMKVRSKIVADFEKAWEKVDAIIAPVMPTTAFKLGERTKDPLKMYLADIFTAPVNLAGIPALAIPSGFAKNKLPLGFQLIGPRWGEFTLFALGKLYQNVNNI